MSATQTNPLHNTVSYLVGTCEFYFSEDATSVANAISRGWRDFGNLQAFTVGNKTKTLDHFGSFRGKRRRDRIVALEAQIDYKLKADQWDYDILKHVFFGDDLSAFTQSALTSSPADSMFSSSYPGVPYRWYDVLVSSTKLRGLTDFTIGSTQTSVTLDGSTNKVNHNAHGYSADQRVIFSGTLPVELTVGQIYYVINPTTNDYQLAAAAGGVTVIDFTGNGSSVKEYHGLIDGTNYDVDLRLGRVMLLGSSNQTTALYPFVTVPAVTSADDQYMKTMTPFQKITRNGYGRLTIWDQYNPEILVQDHQNFSCTITLDSTSEQDGQKWEDISILVTVTSDPGTIAVRKGNLNTAS